MKARFTTPSKHFTIELEAAGPKELFEVCGQLAEVFEDATCGVCGGSAIYPRMREATTNDNREVSYYEMQCANRECRARLSYGQSTDKVNIWAKRGNAQDGWLPNRGWSVYRPGSGDEHRSQSQAAPPSGTPPPPRSAAPDDENLRVLLAKVPAEAMAELCDSLRERGGDDLCNKAWATANAGKPTPSEVVRKLYAAVKG